MQPGPGDTPGPTTHDPSTPDPHTPDPHTYDPHTYDLADGTPPLADIRRWAGRLLGDADEDVVGDCVLVLTELVSNAFDHSRGPRRIRLGLPGARVLRVEVDDGSTDLPTPGTSRLGGSRGRGMTIIEKLSERWGVDVRQDGKTVWAELAT